MLSKRLNKIVPLGFKRFIYHLLVSNDLDNSMFFKLNNLRKLGYNPSLIIDIGAYKGHWTQRILEIFPDSKVIMIEPQADKNEILSRLQNQHNQIQYIKALLGKENSDQVLFFEMETGSSIYEEQTYVNRNKVHYSMHRLDDLIEIENNSDIFLKLDVQGAELDVLNGAINCLNKTSFILLEASLLNYNAGAPLVAEVVEFLNKNNFVLFDICEMHRKKDQTLFQVDLLFSRNDSVIRKKVNYQI